MEETKCFPILSKVWQWTGIKVTKPCAPRDFMVAFIAKYQQLKRYPGNRGKKMIYIEDRHLLATCRTTIPFTIHYFLEYASRKYGQFDVPSQVIKGRSFRDQTDFETLRPFHDLLCEFRTARKIRSPEILLECKKKWVRMGLRRFRQPEGPFDRNLWILYDDTVRKIILTFLMVLREFKVCKDIREKLLSYITIQNE